MKLLELGALKWRVYAVLDHRERCNVLDVLIEIGTPSADRMLGMLREYIPERGPDFRNRDRVKNLGDGIYSLREQPKKGPKPRVFFFRDERAIITTEAVDKRDDDVDPFIKRAKEIRTQYKHAKMASVLQIERPEE